MFMGYSPEQSPVFERWRDISVYRADVGYQWADDDGCICCHNPIEWGGYPPI
jgi:hypothetical protein